MGSIGVQRKFYKVLLRRRLESVAVARHPALPPPQLPPAGLNPYATNSEPLMWTEDTAPDFACSPKAGPGPMFPPRTPIRCMHTQQTPPRPAYLPRTLQGLGQQLLTQQNSHPCCRLTHCHHYCADSTVLEPSCSAPPPGLGRNCTEGVRGGCSFPCPGPTRTKDQRIMKRLQVCRNHAVEQKGGRTVRPGRRISPAHMNTREIPFFLPAKHLLMTSPSVT